MCYSQSSHAIYGDKISCSGGPILLVSNDRYMCSFCNFLWFVWKYLFIMSTVLWVRIAIAHRFSPFSFFIFSSACAPTAFSIIIFTWMRVNGISICTPEIVSNAQMRSRLNGALDSILVWPAGDLHFDWTHAKVLLLIHILCKRCANSG